MPNESTLEEVVVRTKTRPEERVRTRRQPPYQVVLLNDDYHSFEFVVGVLCKALGYAPERAFQLMLQAHQTGRAIVWVGAKEVAELKVDQIRTFHETRTDMPSLGPLDCYIEPAPGA
jgi:ATP-dependent Clp protease adaptor protein ClpS